MKYARLTADATAAAAVVDDDDDAERLSVYSVPSTRLAARRRTHWSAWKIPRWPLDNQQNERTAKEKWEIIIIYVDILGRPTQYINAAELFC